MAIQRRPTLCLNPPSCEISTAARTGPKLDKLLRKSREAALRGRKSQFRPNYRAICLPRPRSAGRRAGNQKLTSKHPHLLSPRAPPSRQYAFTSPLIQAIVTAVATRAKTVRSSSKFRAKTKKSKITITFKK